MDEIDADVGRIDLIASDVRAGRSRGELFVRTCGGDGGHTNRDECTKKARALAVDARRPVRLACSLRRLDCVDDNPPGRTCLSELFAKQTGSSASLRLTFLDHFGVHARERQESLGDSTTLSRVRSGSMQVGTGPASRSSIGRVRHALGRSRTSGASIRCCALISRCSIERLEPTRRLATDLLASSAFDLSRQCFS